jgi:hypothetical protein
MLLLYRDQVHSLKNDFIALVGGTHLVCETCLIGETHLVGGTEGCALALERQIPFIKEVCYYTSRWNSPSR